MNKPAALILASASPRRARLMTQLGLAFEVVLPAQVEEIEQGDSPESVAEINARAKAEAVAALHPDRWVMGADTVVARDGILFGKPADRADAERMLRELAGRAHDVYTAVCLCRRADQRRETFCDRTRVWMRPLDPTGIGAYLDKINPYDKAGSYAIQEHGAGIVDRIEGSYTNVVGLPVERLIEALSRLGLMPYTGAQTQFHP